MRIRSIALISSFLAVALFAFAEEKPWYQEPGTPVTLKSGEFVFKARLPRGWSSTETEIVPPPAAASACRVHGTFYSNREWNRFLVAALESDNAARASKESREVLEIGGHPAVSERSSNGGTKVRTFYINLSDLAPDSLTVWRLESDRVEQARDCELQFIALMQSAEITLADRKEQ